ncbi:LysR family transcriptional regulator [Vibrio navarrensis]|jgi:DNA-binding transcriptional LysR family regulator|uniref:LysR family transcriptional regulator n=1 Tax=Vibrio navarrensis TaxID=29495 RepID=A0AAI9G4T6_9VIBR|nr:MULTISPECIES: LysR family transcriptional regulator [Vibrio]EGR2797343.1 LysR family transcriptional regulator [Vibrio navarrensis]EHA1124637.1 LysR family transcriptional regulator [Vibrio navarrensis]EJK2116800.1 LysR family transcriptional regulator [Vibrio navarrensis]EJL6396610.1 LysR family transcriptional regulator [Vibrio navarrensis]EJL6400316.1 LysR family transcriptional regulator [Vibrio navarrensis]
MLDLNWLKTFVTLAEVKHFGKTAAELHMTQPNVSLHIKQLEQNTKAKLIERNPVQLTPAGKRLLKSAKMMLGELQICQADLNAINELTQGTLSIAASDIVSRLLLIHPFQRFKNDYPGIDLALFNTTSAQAVELVKSARADIGFVIAQKESQPLHFTALTQIQWCAFGDDLFASDWGEQDKPTLILLGHDTRTRELIDASLPKLALPKYRVMEVGSVEAQIDWAQAGFGTAIVPDFSLHTKAALTRTVTHLEAFPATDFGYIVRQNQVLSKAAKQLLGWVEEYAQSTDWH